MRTLLFISLLILFVFAKNTYPIAEPDLLEEIERNKAIAERKLRAELKKYNEEYFQTSIHKDWRVRLPLAKKSRTERIDWVYELETDIPRVDESGRIVGILYPKGYRFRPLQYFLVEPPTLIVFDGYDKRQIKIVKALLKRERYRMLIASDGRIFDLMEQFQERVFLLHPKLKSLAQIKEGVSVIKWDRKSGHIVKEVYGEDALKKLNP